MKRYFILVFLLIVTPLFSLEFSKISFNEAITLAKKEKKLIFLMIDSETCPWCKKMKATSLKNEEVMEILKLDYISIKRYKKDKDLKREFNPWFLPTVFIIDPYTEKEVSRRIGYTSSDDLYNTLFDATD